MLPPRPRPLGIRHEFASVGGHDCLVCWAGSRARFGLARSWSFRGSLVRGRAKFADEVGINETQIKTGRRALKDSPDQAVIDQTSPTPRPDPADSCYSLACYSLADRFIDFARLILFIETRLQTLSCIVTPGRLRRLHRDLPGALPDVGASAHWQGERERAGCCIAPVSGFGFLPAQRPRHTDR
ncbi:hypothetical protein N658DRAFT_360220 [Parathielavia hyrcaniae]|uniref:Uncharacterized protein n=1 Tax=Parathielavia hyrcaniae TaxID=113614 RepID=A0AAN6T351_9PEZI|nr:hypothetical protein N658DRAFT_360220 [Parathielavia hyrcaniae]